MNLDSSNISQIRHDLRTPLNHILGYSEMLLEDADDVGFPQSLADLKKIHAAGMTLLEFVNGHLGKDREKKLIKQGLPDLLPLARPSVECVLDCVKRLGKQATAAGPDHDQWKKDLQRIGLAARNWIRLAQQHLQPRPEPGKAAGRKSPGRRPRKTP